ncbi:EnvZ/OmpR regulon moderator MzrA [Rahnella sp. SAP-1]|uniref:EnvZ/OmpR regulon moderator MzrA n=1 Tax=Rouxiella aceris TaxID=2703884 RepID=A0A848MJJ8_9GAMM|nr:EnvZ/OmpR regulon moderator MzrA [Rouxiella aceris]NMP28648.1 EnvZ/OmpR regulon moderator MzrA [Rouxiella aceris]
MLKLNLSKGYVVWPAVILALLMLTTVGVIALPGMPENNGALKISPIQSGADLPDGFTLYQGLSQHGVQIESITPANGSLVVKLQSQQQQQLAQDTLKTLLPNGYAIKACSGEQPHQWVSKLTRDQSKFG